MKSNKLSTLIAIGALFTAGLTNAFAGDQVGGENYVDFNNFVSTKTRTEVIAELNAARAQGQLAGNQEVDYPTLPVAQSTRSRNEVRVEAAAAMNTQHTIDYSSGR